MLAGKRPQIGQHEVSASFLTVHSVISHSLSVALRIGLLIVSSFRSVYSLQTAVWKATCNVKRL